MTEVAQVAAIVALDMDDVTNMSDAENKEEDTTHEEDDVAVDEEDDAAEEKSVETSHVEDEESRHMDEGESNETEKKTRMNGVDHEEEDDSKMKSSETVNGVKQDTETKEDEELDTNEDQSMSDMSDMALKKEVSEDFKITSDDIHVCGWCDSLHRDHFPLLNKSFHLPSHCWTTETHAIQEAGGQKLRAEAEQRQGRGDGQVRGHAEGPGGAQQAEEHGRAAEEEGSVRQGERVEPQEAAGQRQITPLTSDPDLHGMMRHDDGVTRLPVGVRILYTPHSVYSN